MRIRSLFDRQRTTMIATAFLVAAAMVVSAAASAAEKRTQMVAMRDATRLATDVYVPPDAKDPLPVILIRTPYGKNPLERMATPAHQHGYVLVVQDMRGRFESQGDDAVVFHNDGWAKRRDGHDTIDWIAGQSWCDGKVATWGASAMGISQNMLAPDAPAALTAQNVAVAFSNMYTQAAYQGGAFRKALVEGWLEGNRFGPKNLQTLLAHPTYDKLWSELNPEARADRVNAPGMFTGGWYDIFLQGTINSFQNIHTRGGPRARGNCRLVIGPIAHGRFDELKYPPSAEKKPPGASPYRFFDHFVRGIDNGAENDKPVNYYVMGDPTDRDAPGNYWRSVERWPPPSKPTRAYLHADGGLRLKRPTGADEKLSYKYDPSNPVPTVGGQNLNMPKGPMDQRKIESRSDVLLFTSDLLDKPLEVTGRLHAKLYVSSDCTDTDFTVKLTDVYPDGRSMLLTDGILRARFRKSFERESLIEPGEVYELTVDLWCTSIVFNRGHKIRVAISSSNAPRFDPNPNTGHPLRADKETRVATNTLHLSKQHPSHIVLPVPIHPTSATTTPCSLPGS
ncbi:MAG: CocE/NonD family hydrolase [Candidatus Nealsonbacteria bacterium]|nr:CocE/NonD family hydrolase [Candidatus Nealsonbacteria bacterium]